MNKRHIDENSVIKNILIVDDDMGLRSILSKSFQVIGFKCSEAEDALTAYEMIRKEKFDLVISDISMPVMDGIELMKKVKREFPDIDFIIMTGFSGDYSYVDIIDAGAADYMTKPFGINSAAARIERIEREKRTLLNLKKTNLELNSAMEKAKALAEESKVLAEEAKAASQAKTDFLANMSHEIRTPLNGILGYIDIFYNTALTQEQREYVHNAKISCEVLLSVVNDILDFSKVEAGQLSIEKIEFDPEVLCFEALEVVRSKVNEAKVEIVCRVSDSVPALAIGDPYRFRQVLLNLLGNAAKFTSSGVIELSLDVNEETETDILLQASVKDTGIGIPSEKLNSIFEPFQQSDATTTRRFGGTGLGLAICRKIAEKMEGSVWADSTLGKGSTFYFTSRLQKQATSVTKRFKPVGLKGKKAFLSISKSTPLRDIVINELAGLGMVVVPFDNVNEVLTFFINLTTKKIDKNHRTLNTVINYELYGIEDFDIGIVDAGIKSNAHIDFAKSLRKLPGIHSKIPLLVCISPDPGGAERCRKAGYNGFLSKPIQRKKLFTMISAILGLEKSAAEQNSGSNSPLEENKILTTHLLAENFKHSVTILLVEDNPVNQKMAKIMLTKAGYSVEIAGNGIEAVSTYLEKIDTIDMIFMDINMPEMDGLEATRRIRELENEGIGTIRDCEKEHKRVPIVALTANALKEFEDRCLEAGMDDFLTKPLKRELVFQSVKKWVSQ